MNKQSPNLIKSKSPDKIKNTNVKSSIIRSDKSKNIGKNNKSKDYKIDSNQY